MITLKTKLMILLAVCLLTSIGYISYLNYRIQSQQQTISLQTNNLKAERYKTLHWQDEYGKNHSKSIEQIRSISELRRGNDSLMVHYRELLAKNNIKIKDVGFVGGVSTVASVTLVINYKLLQGCHDLSDKDITNIVCINKDSSITSNILLKNEVSIIGTSKKETINPERKFFLWRWFQKKQIVTYVEVIQSNPYVKSEKQNFTIIGK